MSEGGDHNDEGPDWDVEALHRVYMKVGEHFSDRDVESMDPKEVLSYMIDYLDHEEGLPQEVLKEIRQRLEGLSI